MHTQIKLLLLEQSDKGLHCLSYYQYFLDTSDGSQKDLIKLYVNYGADLVQIYLVIWYDST